MDDEALRRIRWNGDFAIEQFAPLVDFQFGYTRQSVEWVEGFIDRQRASRQDHGQLVSVLGSFLGEAIIVAAGGAWDDVDGSYGIAFNAGEQRNVCFPFAKVAKQFANGPESGDGILSFYDVAVDVVAKGKLGA